MFVLCYDFIEGASDQPSVVGWSQILKQVDKMHNIDFVHGDWLPRNILFGIGVGYIIDFDLSREDGEPYVKGFNYEDFREYRHKDAKAGSPMKKEHAFYSLLQLSKAYFDLTAESMAAVLTMKQLIQFFNMNTDVAVNPDIISNQRSTI
jgi:serine/threonine protein kinase